jgi:hypothetical protein
LTWAFCFPWNPQKVTSSQTIKRYTQDQRLKLTQRTMKKVILILQRVISVFKLQDSQKITLNSVCWVFDQRNLISKNTFKNWHLFDFISQLDLNRHDLWNIWFDLILEQRRLSNKKNIDWICKIPDRNDINTSRHSLKSWPLGAIQWTLRRKTNSIQIS